MKVILQVIVVYFFAKITHEEILDSDVRYVDEHKNSDETEHKQPLTMDAVEEMAHKIGLLLLPQEPHKRSNEKEVRDKDDTKKYKKQPPTLTAHEYEALDPLKTSEQFGNFHIRRKRD